MDKRSQNKKKSTRNAYWFFVEEFRKKERSNMSWDKASEIASPIWKELRPDEREKYSQLAKQHKVEAQNTMEKYTSIGVPVSEFEKGRQMQAAAINLENETIAKEMEHGAETDIRKKQFFIIHTNYYCITQNNKYITCEVGLVMFSLENGLEAEYHTLINREIPMGYSFDSREGAKECGVPVPPLTDAENDLSEIFSSICNVLLMCTTRMPEEKSLPPVYAMPEDVKPTTSFMVDIAEAAGYDADLIRVYPLDKLFHRLHLTAVSKDVGLPNESLYLNALKKDIFTFSKNLGCSMHEREDNFPKCSLARVKRHCFTICDFSCKPLNINVIPGKHLPADSENTPSSSRFTSRPSSVQGQPSTSASVSEDSDFITVVGRGRARRGRGRGIVF